MVVDWVNSLDISSCSLVDSLDDLKSGAVVGDIVAWMKNVPSIRGIERVLVNTNEAYNNWNIILNELHGILPIQLQEIDPQDLIEEDTFLLYFMKFISNLDNKEAEKIHKDMPLTYNDRPQTPVISNHNRSDSAVTNRYQESPIVQEQIRGQVSKTPSKKTGKPPIPPSVNTPGRKSINTSQDRMAHIEVEEEDTFEINVIQKHAINSLRKSDEMMIKEMPTEYKPSLIKKTEDGKAPELRDRSNFLRKNDDQSEESSLTRKNQDLNLEESVKPRIIQEEAPLRSKLYIENGPKEIIRKSYEEPTRKNDEYRPAINSYTAKLQEESQNEAPQRPPQQSKYEAKPVPEIVQEAVIEWLENLHIVRKGTLNHELLPNVCRTGVLICDVINRIEGRTEVIKGVERAPKNRTQALTNVNKTLEFLRTHPKMNSRYLWSAKNVLDGDEYVVWGLLEDIKTFYTVAPKTNNHSVSRRENSINRSRFSPNNSYLANNLPFSAQQSAIMSVAQNSPHNQSAVVARHHIQEPNATKEMVIPKSFLQEKSKNLRSYAASARSRTPISRTPTSQTPLLMSPRVNRPPSSLTKKPSKSQTFISEDTKNQIKLWLYALDIEYEETNDNKYTDPLRNGLLVCELIRVLENVQLKVNPNPRNEKAIKENFEKALMIMQEKRTEIPDYLFSDVDVLLRNTDSIWGLVLALMSAYPQGVALAYQNCSLPYGALGIKRLESAVLNWLVSLEIFNSTPSSFFETIYDFKTGVLLCVIISKICGWRIQNVIKNPKTEQSCLNNIRKALEVLRKTPKMSQKFTWSEKEIVKGNPGVILGLLEDIYRCYDGLQTRKPGAEYHKDGPYLGKSVNLTTAGEHKVDVEHTRTPSWKAKQDDSFTGTFGSNDTPKAKQNKRVSYSDKGLSPSTTLDAQQTSFDDHLQQDPECLLSWLNSVGATFPRTMTLIGEYIPEFTTGTLLSELISQLEKIKIPGVEKEPKTKTSALKNIRRALDILKRKPTFPQHLTAGEELIFQGDGNFIRTMLHEMMKIYRLRASRSSLKSMKSESSFRLESV